MRGDERPARQLGVLSSHTLCTAFLTSIYVHPATLPTIGEAVECLSDTCENLSNVFLKIVDLSAELASPDSIRVDNIKEVRIPP